MSISPLVTVYITNFNYARFVRQAIESVRRQTYPNIELIIIDDGSTDNSREILAEYEGISGIKVIYQQNKGLNATNNVALVAATGTYFIRLDADDYFEPYAIALMVSMMEGRPEIGLVFPDYYYVDEIGNIIGVESRHDFDREVSLYDVPAHGACTMVRTRELRKLGGYNEAFTCQDGYELWLKYILHSRVSNINKPLFYYRKHKSNLTSDESRILETRKQIKRHYVSLMENDRPSGVAIVPIRPNTVGGKIWALHRRNGITELARSLQKLIDAACFQSIIVTSSDQQVLDEAERFASQLPYATQSPKIQTYQREYIYELANHSLEPTLQELVREFQLDQHYEIMGLLGIETPLIKASTLTEAVDSLLLFNSDSVISVRPDTATYFTHNGDGMKVAFERTRYTNYERKVLYKRISGFTVTRMEAYLRHHTLVTPRLGHLVVGPEEALTIQSDIDLVLYEALGTGTEEAINLSELNQ